VTAGDLPEVDAFATLGPRSAHGRLLATYPVPYQIAINSIGS